MHGPYFAGQLRPARAYQVGPNTVQHMVVDRVFSVPTRAGKILGCRPREEGGGATGSVVRQAPGIQGKTGEQAQIRGPCPEQ